MCLDQYQLLLCGGAHAGPWTAATGICSHCSCRGGQCCRSLLEEIFLEVVLLGAKGQILTTEDSVYPCFPTPAHTELIMHSLSIGLFLPSHSASPETLLVSRAARKDWDWKWVQVWTSQKSQKGNWFGQGCKLTVWDPRPSLWPSPGMSESLHVLFSNATLVPLPIKQELQLF